MKRKYPRITLIAVAVGSALFVLATADAQQTRSHLETCTKWDENNNQFGFWNNCGQPVTVQFMQLDAQRPTQREVKPGARFSTGVTQEKLRSTGWMSTRCPVGYGPSVPFTAENRDAIIESRYECVKK